jgi:hypothetical protein
MKNTQQFKNFIQFAMEDGEVCAFSHSLPMEYATIHVTR